MSSVIAALRRNALENGQHDCLVSEGGTLSYAEVWRLAVAARQWLLRQGVQPGQRIAISPDAHGTAFLVAYLGAHLAGAIVVPLDEKMAVLTRDRMMAQAEPSLVLGSKSLIQMLETLRTWDLVDGEDLVMPRPDTTADIIFTSGTTGQPKGVVLTHGNIFSAANSINAFIQNGSADREVITIPLVHSFGLGRLRCNLVAGGTSVIVRGFTFPALVLQALTQSAATGLSCVPMGMTILLQRGVEELRLLAPRLRYIELGSAPMMLDVKKQLAELLPTTRICMHYGLTEASRSAFLEFHDDREHLDTVGRPSPGVEIEIRDEDGNAVLPGTEGRIHIRSKAVMQGYWRNPETTRETLLADGWLKTSDLGQLDAAGRLTLRGRVDDMINVGGKKVDPSTVEEAALSFQGVDEAACVAGKSTPGAVDDVPILFVVLAPDAVLEPILLRRYLTSRLDSHALPVEILQLGSLPRTESGKLKRADLRRLLMAGNV